MMFSQLCSARPWAIWDKLLLRPIGDGIPNYSEGPEVNNVHCQLHRCAFCTEKEAAAQTEIPGCQHTNDLSNDVQDLKEVLKATENPAYGLSDRTFQVAGYDEIRTDGRSQLSNKFKLNVLHDESESKNGVETENSEALTASQDNLKRDGPSMMTPFNTPKIGNQMKTEPQQLNSLIGNMNPEASSKSNDCNKHSRLLRTAFKHKRHTDQQTLESCDKLKSNVIQQANVPDENLLDKGPIAASTFKPKRNIKDMPFPPSFIDPIDRKPEAESQTAPILSHPTEIAREKSTQRNTQEKSKQLPNKNRTKSEVNPKDIPQIKTEENIQEWLARISVTEDGGKKPQPAWSLHHSQGTNQKEETTSYILSKIIYEALEITYNSEPQDPSLLYIGESEEGILRTASKTSPANIPMVVMQFARLHSHIGSKPPFHQTALQMGTLVTALYQESDWIYIQTPHGVEGFINASDCAPLGKVEKQKAVRRPWDFPVKGETMTQTDVTEHSTTHTAKQHYARRLKVKNSIYNDRYFNQMFKTKEPIRTAKTVTDILRNSPDTKIS